ncbi:Rft-1-domain-containing protein [Fomitiporia mediterranea MF3/22]|uniref:Rft-1-domain-containing protein n=1 Tax=Fomitiporia mediterranea (strain MF3/22) TaxID=694068 RepID=UPI0004408EF1|nr:Rft-1-domain-containing protein [Fomitiporia mediterranea MF3/22]EJD06490.1 Rft-1-domain-containing protein [Fomitiporia mediterranea MF3/22]
MGSQTVTPDKKSEETQNDLANKALETASSLMGLQVLSRLVTFALNQALVRLATPAVYGTVSIQLELLLNTILFLSREGFRNALLRADADGNAQKEQSLHVSNIALLPVYFGILVSSLTSTLYFYSASEATAEQPYFHATVILYTCAAVLELLSEPMHIRAVQQLNSAVRVRAEGSAIILKSVVTVTILLIDSSSKNSGRFALLAFAFGQLSFSIALLLVYVPKVGKSVSLILRAPRSTRPAWLTSKVQHYFDERLLEVSLAMTAQGFLKHILTEGDKIIISRISPLKDQGGYAVANNYGALIARIFFQPIEETSRLFFSKSLSLGHAGTPDIASLRTSLARLGSLLLFYSHFSLFLLSLAPPYLTMVLSVILPPRQVFRYLATSAPAVLSVWVWYIPVLAINGILEAFVSSVATPKALARQSQWMAGGSAAYILLTIGLYRFGGLGDTAVVYANIANLSARILYCTQFISTLVHKRPYSENAIKMLSWKDVLPPFSVMFAFAVAGVVTRLTARLSGVEDIAKSAGRGVLKSKPCILHLGVGASCGLVLLAVW